MSSKKSIPCTIMRGGTSKGLFFLEKDLPPEGRDALLLEVMGSPDKKQIDGLGGAASVTSKVAIIGPSERPDADVNYTFAQVSVDKALVSYMGNCGNISSAVGPFAIEKGLVEAVEPVTAVRIYNTNTRSALISEVAVKDGEVVYAGDYAIAGVPGTGSKIKLRFRDPAGAVTGKLLPTGNPVDQLDVPGLGPVEVSIVDAANPLVFVSAEEIGMGGTELPGEIDSDPALLERLETIRGLAAAAIGLTDDYRNAAWTTPGVPKMSVVSPPKGYTAVDGTPVEAGKTDITLRMMSMQKAHPSCAMTGAMCIVAAAALRETVVGKLCGPDVDLKNFRIGHPGGVISVGAEARGTGAGTVIDETYGYRTANLLMDGTAYYHGNRT